MCEASHCAIAMVLKADLFAAILRPAFRRSQRRNDVLSRKNLAYNLHLLMSAIDSTELYCKGTLGQSFVVHFEETTVWTKNDKEPFSSGPLLPFECLLRVAFSGDLCLAGHDMAWNTGWPHRK